MTKQQHSRHKSFFVTYFIMLGIFLGMASVSVAEISTDGSLGPKGPLAGPNYQIPDTLGQTRGSNLFHSFDKFNIETGYSATFTGPNGIKNVMSRVTGGSPSSIDGLLRCTIDGANLYLMNPSGVMFGPNASLDVKGSFHVSTADYLKFSDGGVFYANPNVSSVLSVADPQAFGFLSSNPAGISIQKSILTVPMGNTLSLVGGDINIVGDTTYDSISAPSGRINLVSVASPGEVNLNTPDLGMNSFTKLGNINVLNTASLNVQGSDYMTQPAGSVFIRGGQILFQSDGNKSNIDARGNPGGTIDIKGETLRMDGGGFDTATRGAIDHPGTGCRIDLSGDLLMTNASEIASSSYGLGRAGDIRINASNVKLGDDTPGTGPWVSTGFYGDIGSRSFGAGRGGDVFISAGSVMLQNGFYINTAAMNMGDAGNVTVHADTVKLLDQGSISSNGFGGQGTKGGDVEIVARDILISAKNATAVTNANITTGISAVAYYSSNGGKIIVTADNLQLMDGGKIYNILYGTGHGADDYITAKSITVSGYYLDPRLSPAYALTSIDARVYGTAATGTGGNINISADSLKIADYGTIRTGLYSNAPGKAGNININAGEIEISNKGQIYANSFRGTGDSGDININANNIIISGIGNSPTPPPPALASIIFTGLSTTTNAGRGGTINLSITGDLSLTSWGGINADTQGTGKGGAINIGAQNVLLTNQSTISSSSYGAGPGGIINISTAGDLSVKNYGTLSAAASGAGAGGAINIEAQNVRLTDQGIISSSSSGAGNAGNIAIAAGNSVLMRDSSITTEAIQADGGNIEIHAPFKVSLIDSKITASVGGGPQTTGGNITIDPQFVILKNSQIIANAFEGKGGNIQINTNVFLADPESVVDASSALGINGTVDIRAPITNVSGLLNPLPADFFSATALLRERCIARIQGGKYSSFVVGSRDGLPIEPGNLMPGFLH